MNSKTMCAIAFSLGGAVGSFVTWRLLKTTYENFTRDTIAEVKEYYAHKYGEDNDPPESEPPVPTKEEHAEDVKQYVEATTPYRAPMTEEEVKTEQATVGEPFVISPHDLGGDDEFDIVTLTYYTDGVLVTDDTNEVVDDIEDLVGSDFASHFGEYEDDSVCVRNPRMRIDYEILRDESTFFVTRNAGQKEVQ